MNKFEEEYRIKMQILSLFSTEELREELNKRKKAITKYNRYYAKIKKSK